MGIQRKSHRVLPAPSLGTRVTAAIFLPVRVGPRVAALPQIFHRGFNTLSKVTIFGGVFFLALAALAAGAFVRSSYATQANIIRDQIYEAIHQGSVHQWAAR